MPRSRAARGRAAGNARCRRRASPEPCARSREQLLGDAPVAGEHPPACGPAIDAEERRRALDAAVRVARRTDPRRPSTCSRTSLQNRVRSAAPQGGRPGRHEPLLDLAGVEESVAVAERDAEDRAAAVTGAHHVDHLEPLARRLLCHGAVSMRFVIGLSRGRRRPVYPTGRTPPRERRAAISQQATRRDRRGAAAPAAAAEHERPRTLEQSGAQRAASRRRRSRLERHDRRAEKPVAVEGDAGAEGAESGCEPGASHRRRICATTAAGLARKSSCRTSIRRSRGWRRNTRTASRWVSHRYAFAASRPEPALRHIDVARARRRRSADRARAAAGTARSLSAAAARAHASDSARCPPRACTSATLATARYSSSETRA